MFVMQAQAETAKAAEKLIKQSENPSPKPPCASLFTVLFAQKSAQQTKDHPVLADTCASFDGPSMMK